VDDQHHEAYGVTKSVEKTDRRYAATIVEFLKTNMLPGTSNFPTESEDLRLVLRIRTVLIRLVMTFNTQMLGLLLSLSIKVKKKSSQSPKGRVLNVLEDHGLAGQTVEALLQTIDQHQLVELLKTNPGIRITTATIIWARLDEISRFVSYKRFSVYTGLVPWVQSSNTT